MQEHSVVYLANLQAGQYPKDGESRIWNLFSFSKKLTSSWLKNNSIEGA